MRDPEPLVLGLRRIYILPTRGGYAFGGVLLVMLLGSANYNNGLGYAFTFLLGSLALVSLLHSNRNLTGLRLTGGVAQAVFSGDEAGFTLHVDNRGQRDRYDLQLRYGFDPKSRADLRAVRLHLAADEQGRIEMPTSTNGRGRGWLSLPRVTIASRYPLGLFRAWSDLYLDFRCLVYPRPVGTRDLPPLAADSRRDGGNRGSGRDDFAGLREYRSGDPPRLIHWKAAAREQGIPLKLFTGTSLTNLKLQWADTVGPTEERLSQMCRWVLEADKLGHRYALSMPGLEFPLDDGEAHRSRCLEVLALFGQPGYEALPEVGPEARPMVEPNPPK